MNLELTKPNVAIVGMAEASRHLAPFNDPEWEVWGLNESYFDPFMKSWDRWFQLHPKWDYSRLFNPVDPNHWGWLKGEGRRTDFPIYMLEQDPEIPGSVEYPLDDVVNAYRVNAEHVRYFTSSVALMTALALHLKPKKLAYYGLEMELDSEYVGQRPCAEFWIGIAIGKDIPLILPEKTPLLGHKSYLYGYDKVPGVDKTFAELHYNTCLEEVIKQQQKVAATRAARETIQAHLRDGSLKGTPEVIQELQEVTTREINELILEATYDGARQNAKFILEQFTGIRMRDELKPIDSGITTEFGASPDRSKRKRHK